LGVVHTAPTPRFEGDDYVRYGEFAPDHEGVSWQVIAETILDAPAADITFTNIPQTFRTLALHAVSRSDRAATQDSLGCRLNGDSAANYDRFWLQVNNGAVPTTEALAQTSIIFGQCTGNTAPANLASSTIVYFLEYARTVWEKPLLFHAVNKRGVVSGDISLWFGTGYWRSTAAITDIQIYALAGNLMTDTVVTLWGLI
jgi:hypothetical protein